MDKRYEEYFVTSEPRRVVDVYNEDDVNPLETQTLDSLVDAERLELSRTAAGEGRNQGLDGMRLIMQTIKNRAADKKWPGTIQEVTRQPKQFSAWNKDDSNRPYMESLNLDSNDSQFLQAYEIAEEDLPEHLIKFKDADHYHTDKVSPSWSKSPKIRKLGQYKDHIFYSTKPGTGVSPAANLKGGSL